jgi:hypothetical protein
MMRVRCSTVVTHVTTLPASLPSAQTSCSPGKRATNAVKTCLAPSRSWIPAECIILTIDNTRTGLTGAARGLAQIPTEAVVPLLPDVCPALRPEIVVDRLVGRKVCRKHPPLAPAPQAGEDGIDHLAYVGGARAATRFGRGNERRQDGPFHVREIWWIALHHPVPSSHKVIRGLTHYHAGHFSDRL